MSLGLQPVLYQQEVADVVGGVMALGGTQGSSVPLREGVAASKHLPRDGLDEVRKRQGVGMPGEGGDDLRVEDRGGRNVQVPHDRLEILRARVHDGADRRIRHESPQVVQGPDREGVDQRDPVGRGHLEQADPRVVAFLADELGVEGECADLADVLQE